MLYTIHTIRRVAKSRFRSPSARNSAIPRKLLAPSAAPFRHRLTQEPRDVDRDAVRCMGHLAWCPRQWGSWVVSSIVRYRADMPCRTAMCFMVHKSMHTIMKRCICTGRALCGRFTCHISLFAARQRVHNTSLTLGLGLGRLSGRHRPKLCSWPPHKHRCPWLSIGYG